MISVFGVLVQLMLYLNRILETYVFGCDEMQINDNLLLLLNCYPSQERGKRKKSLTDGNKLSAPQCSVFENRSVFPFSREDMLKVEL